MERNNPAECRLGSLRYELGRCICVVAVLLLGCGWASGQSVTQNFTLQPGWNSIYLEVQPADPAVGHVFSNPAIDSVWEPKVRASTVAFIQNQNEAAFNRGGWAVYVPTNRPEAINNNLFAVAANRAYLVKVNGTSAIAVSVTGRPSLSSLPFQPDGLTLRGFLVDPANPPTFQTFFGPSGAHYNPSTGLQTIYRLNNRNSLWELVAATDLLTRGVSYWVNTAGASSYLAPLAAVASQGDGLDFGTVAEVEDLTLVNNTPNPMAVSIRDLGAGNRPLTYYFYSPTNTVPPAWLPLPAVYSLTLYPGTNQLLRLGIQRSQMINDTYQTVLAVSDGNGTLLRVPVTAQRPPLGPGGGGTIPAALQAGLWIGTISVGAVAETYNNITNTTPTKGSFDLRVLLHVRTNGVTRFLREVIEMFQNGAYTNDAAGNLVLSQSGQVVLLTDDTLLSQYTGTAMRDSTPVHGEFVIKGPRSRDPTPLPPSPMPRKLLAHENRDCIAGESAGQTGRSPGNWRDPSRAR